jgi:3',5'-cyclic AMP phosphodiesterase CpdA
MRFAHISDLHFGAVTLSPLQFFSKRWLGNLNFLLARKKRFHYERLYQLLDLFKKEEITHVIISGDLSVTARKKEFKRAQAFIEALKKEGLTVYTIPGNHDHYTRWAYRRKHFYRYFDSRFDPSCPYNLQDHKVTYTKLQEHLWLVGLDTALATSLISSQGHFCPKVEENLEKILSDIPKSDTILLVNHFPLFNNSPPKKELIRAPLLKALLKKHPNILLYLNGHSHRQTVADLRQSDLPILSDSGSTPHVKTGACHLIEMAPKALRLDVFYFDQTWKKQTTHHFER